MSNNSDSQKGISSQKGIESNGRIEYCGVQIIKCSLNDNIMFCCMFEHGVQCYYKLEDAERVIDKYLKSSVKEEIKGV